MRERAIRKPVIWQWGVLLCLTVFLPTQSFSETAPAWTGHGARRLLVKVASQSLSGRTSDLRPTRVAVKEPFDPGSVEIIRYDAKSGQAVSGPLKFRFDSNPMPLFQSHYWPGDGSRGGTLVWEHEQQGNNTSYYAIYFNPWTLQATVAPRQWIGDGDIPYVARSPFPQVLMVRPFGADWDGDGKTDVFVGDQLGYVTFYRNLGTESQPSFGLGEPVLADGKLAKVQWCAAPVVVDWNGDGLLDLLVAQEPQGVIRYYQNVGTRQEPQLTDKGLLQADGEVLKTPYLPVPEMPPGVFKDTYGSIPTVVDWDGDGKLSLLAGTYITGQIYLYRNVGQNADGTPQLHLEGPLKADGKEIDVIWNSTPATADLNGDDKMDLISGSFGMSATGGDRPDLSRLHYYIRTNDSLHEESFPFDEPEDEAMKTLFRSGGAPFSTALADMNHDGLVDLLVGTNVGTVTYLQNVGSRSVPKFHFVGNFEGSWVPTQWSFDSIVDFRGDGKPSLLIGGYGVRVELATGEPPFAARSELKTVSGKSMGKVAAHGDEFGNAQSYDFDNDGKPDIVFGTVDGNVLLYRNTGTRQDPQFADAETMMLASGTPLVAGFSADTKVTDFTVLQGNRAIPAAADFNGDGKTDLVIGNTIGQLLYFENVGDNRHPKFAPAEKLLGRSGRVFVTATDWDGDSLPDLIVAASGDNGPQVVILRHVTNRKQARFLDPLPVPALSQVPYPVPAVWDWNHDGDPDIMLASSYGFVYFLDGSYVKYGYAKAEVTRAESREAAASGHPKEKTP